MVTDFKKQGKKNRAQGASFEKRVFEDLKSKGWTVSRWPNKIIENELVQAKAKWINGRVIGMNSGFTDFFATKLTLMTKEHGQLYENIGIECKINNTLDKKEKDQLEFYLKNKIFSKILIASKEKVKGRIKINYREYTNA